jgi:hypothetical protein
MDQEIRGRTTSHEDPNWEPLLRLAPEHVDDFMWMFEVKLDDGTWVHAYKHCETRRYLHLGEDGRAFYYREPNIYCEIGACRLLDLVLRGRESYTYYV